MPGIFASRAINSCDSSVSLPLSGPSSEIETGRLFWLIETVSPAMRTRRSRIRFSNADCGGRLLSSRSASTTVRRA